VSFLRQLSTLGPNTCSCKVEVGRERQRLVEVKEPPSRDPARLARAGGQHHPAQAIAPHLSTDASVTYGGKSLKHVDIRGSTSKYLEDAAGRSARPFLTDLITVGSDACVVGADVEEAFFKGQEPLGQRLRVGPRPAAPLSAASVRKGTPSGSRKTCACSSRSPPSPARSA